MQASIWTAAPSDPGTPLNWFQYTDPFALVLSITIDQWVIDEGRGFNATYQVVNPRQDPFNHAWFTFFGGNITPMPTIDNDWIGIPLNQAGSYLAWLFWGQYADFASQVAGPDSTQGVFYAQGTLTTVATDTLAIAQPFWFQVVDIGVISQP